MLFAARLSLCEIQTLSKRTRSISRVLGGLSPITSGGGKPEGKEGGGTILPCQGTCTPVPIFEHDAFSALTSRRPDALIWMQNKEKEPLQGVSVLKRTCPAARVPLTQLCANPPHKKNRRFFLWGPQTPAQTSRRPDALISLIWMKCAKEPLPRGGAY